MTGRDAFCAGFIVARLEGADVAELAAILGSGADGRSGAGAADTIR